MIVGAASFVLTFSVFANPVVDNVASGNVSIQQTTNSTVVNQTSQKAIINWSSFNIGAQESTHFQQPAGGVVLNRISPTQGASSIYGSLTATGQIILVNPAGVYFGPSAYVNVGGLIATTGNITDQNFLNGKYIFATVPGYSGAIINEGQIIAANHGLIALLAAGVMNNGYIEANLGKVVLGSGNAFTLTFEGQDLISFTVDQATISRGVDQNGNALPDGVKNNGVIRANGGQILVTARAAAGVLDNVVNMGGVLQAQSVGDFGGDIVLSADTSIINDNVIRLSGLVDATGRLVNQIGGHISVTGSRVIIDPTAKIDASGYAGGGQIFIGGNAHGMGPLANANKTTVAAGATINADAINQGNGGQIVIWSNLATNFYGEISAKGGVWSGNGGWVETSSKLFLDVNGATVNLLAAAGKVGTWLLDPTNIFIAVDQASATAAGMSGSDASADTGSGGDPNTFAASNAVTDSLLTTANLTAALGTANVIVTTTNGLGTSTTGNITVVDPITWSSGNYLALQALNNIALNATITMNSAAASLILNAGGMITQSAPIAGSGGLTISAGTVNLSQANTYTGPTDIQHGTVNLTTANAIANSSSVTIADAADASISIADVDQTFNNLSGGGATGGNINLGSSTLTVYELGNATYGGVISGTGGLTIAGLNYLYPTLVLSGNNTYSGETNIGLANDTVSFYSLKLSVSNPDVFDSTSAINLHLGSALIFNGLPSGPQVFGSSAPINMYAGQLGYSVLDFENNNNSTLTLNNSISTNHYVGDSNGAPQLATNLFGFSGDANASLIVNGDIFTDGNVRTASGVSGDIITLNGQLHNSGTLFPGYFSGGTLFLNNDNSATYSGNIVLYGGTVKVGSSNSLGTGTLEFFSGTLEADSDLVNPIPNDYSVFAGGIGVLGGASSFTLSGNGFVDTGATLATSNTGGTITLSGNISGAGALHVNSSQLELSGNNTYTGGTIVGDGINPSTLIVDNSASLGTNAVTVNNGSVLQLNGTNLDVVNAITLNDGSTISSNNMFGTNIFDGPITLANSSSGIFVDLFGMFEVLTFNGPISGTSVNLNFNFGALNSNSIVLTGANTFTGNVAVTGESGTLALANNQALGADNSTTTTLGAGTILAFAGSNLTIANDLVIGPNTNLTPTTILESNSSSANTLSGNIDFGSGNYALISISGGGTGDQLTLSGILSGATTNLTIGSLGETNTLVLSGASANTYSGTTNIVGDVVSVQKNNAFGTSNVAVQGGAEVDINAANITLNNSFNLNGNGISGYQGRLSPYGALVDLSSSSSNVVNGNLTLGSASSIGVNTSGNSLTLNGVIDDGGNGFILTKLGSGNLSLTNANTYSGGTHINAGSITIANSGALGSGLVSVTSGAQLAINGNGLSMANNIQIAGSGLSGSGALVDRSTTGNSNTLTGNVAMTASSTVGVANSGAALALEGVLSGAGFNLTKVGSGILSLSSTNTNTYTGSTVVSSGTLQLLGDNDFGTSSNTSAVSVATGAMLNLVNVNITPAIPLTLTGTLSASGTSSYAGGITLNSGNSITNTGTLTLSGQLTGSGALNKNGAGILILNNNANNYTGVTNINLGTLQINADNVLPNNDLTVLAGATFDVNNFIETIGALAGNGNVTLGTSTGGTLITSGATSSTFAGSISGGVIGNGGFTKGGSGTLNFTGINTYVSATTVTGGILQLSNANALGDGVNNTSGVTVQNGGEIFLNNVVLTPASLSLSLNGFGVNSAGALNSIGSTAWNGAITLAGNSSIGSTNTNDVLTINGTINGSFGLTLNSNLAQSGKIVFNAPIGAINALANLTANANVTLAGGTVITTGTQNYANVVTLAADTTLNTSNSLVTFSAVGISTINSDSNLTPRALVINTGNGNIIMSSSVGATNALGDITLTSNGTTTLNSTVTAASLTANGASGTTTMNGSLVTTSGNQTYGSAIQLGAATTLNSSNGNGDITFNNTVNGANTLVVNSGGGAVVFNAPFGASSALSSLTTLGTGPVSFAANITTSGIQTYNAAAFVTGNSILTTNNSAINFVSTIDGPASLTLAAGSGAVNLGGTVGAGVALASFSSTGSGTLTVNGGITTIGTQNYTSDILLAADGVFTTTNNAVTLNSINSSGGARDLTVNSGSGAITLNGPTGTTNTINNINLNSSGTTSISGNVKATSLTTNSGGTTVIAANNITTSSNQTYGDAVQFNGTTTTLDSSAGNANIDFNKTINGAANVILNAGSGIVNLGDAVGASVALASLSSIGSGLITFDGATSPVTVRTTGNQLYNGATELDQDINFVSTAGNITFNAALDGPFNFSTGSGSGALILNGVVGGFTNLASLVVNMPLTMNSNAITTVGNQIYNRNVTLNAATTDFNTNSTVGATVAFNNGISGNTIYVTGNAAGDNTLVVNTGSTQNWTVAALNGGTLSGMGTVTGAFNFANMNNLSGGSGNDTFTLNGGTLSGDIAGGGGNNTLVADGGVVNNIWQISGTDAGSVTGINNFSSIQNLVGGDGGPQNNNTFIFADGSKITGTITGSSLLNPLNQNTFDFSNYSLMNIRIVSSIFNATALNSSNVAIATYANINFVIGNPVLADTIYLPSQSVLPTTVTLLDPLTRHGTIADPLTFTYFNVVYPYTPSPSPNPTSTSVAQIIQQPVVNNSVYTSSTPILAVDLFVAQNLTSIADQFSLLNETELKEVKINPYCYQQAIQ